VPHRSFAAASSEAHEPFCRRDWGLRAHRPA
jgi:hypothetical protein